MAHSKFIVIKCPACGERFEAEREEEASFISCPECDMQVKISGTHDRKSRSPRRMTPAASLPSRRHQERVQFSDLAAGGGMPIDLEAARRRAQERAAKEELVIEDEELVIDEDEEASVAEEAPSEATAEAPKGKSAPRSGIERRAARLEERAAKLEERAAKLAKMQAERKSAAKEKKSAETSKKSHPDEGAGTPPETEQDDSKSKASAGMEDVEDVEMDKVEVRSTGERRRLRRAPKADVPAPRGRPGAPRYVDDLRTELPKERIPESVSPVQDFDDRKITEGSQWRRHNPSRVDDPDWESDEEMDEEEEPIEYPYQRRRRIMLWTAAGLLGLFVVVAGYQFILAQLGWLEPVGEVREAPPLERDPADQWSKGEMLEEVKPVIEAFLRSTSNEEALQYVLRAGKVGLAMRRHYLSGSIEPMKIKELGDCYLTAEKDFFVVPVTLEDYATREMYFAVPDGKVTNDWLIDWESWVGYSEMRFNELRLRKPKEPVLVRCYVLDEVYYNFDFGDETRYRSFKMFDHNRENQLWGYVDKSSEAFRSMASELPFTEGRGEKMATLRVRFPDQSTNPSNDQVEITDYVGMGWLIKQ